MLIRHQSKREQATAAIAAACMLCVLWFYAAPRASAQVDFAFSVGDGVNAYYLPTRSDFIYAYDGYYYDWAGNGWLYSADDYGPWASLPITVAVPLPLEYGPPPPVFPYQPYFVWWRARIAPWYRMHHPGWWVRHHVDMMHYQTWRARVIPRYRGRPFYRGAIHPVFRPLRPGIRPLRRRPVARMAIHPRYHPYVRHPVVHARVMVRPQRIVRPRHPVRRLRHRPANQK